MLVTTLGAQEPPSLLFRLKETVPVVGELAVAIMNPVKCDPESSLYMRGYAPANPMASPILKISREGKRAAAFAIHSAPGFEEARVNDFAVDLRGKVYMLAIKSKDELAIVAFSRDGQYDSTITLDRVFLPGQLAVFPSGEFLVSGAEIDENRKPTGRPFTAVFDRSGRFIKELVLPLDVQREPPEATHNPTPPSAPQESNAQAAEAPVKLQARDFDRAISLGNAVAADDGNIYLMRATTNPLIYVISPGAEVLRRLVIAAPSENSRSVTVKVAGGRVVVEFALRDPGGRFTQHILVMASAETGEVIARYLSPPEIGGALACYTPDGFIFLAGAETDQLVIRTAYPR